MALVGFRYPLLSEDMPRYRILWGVSLKERERILQGAWSCVCEGRCFTHLRRFWYFVCVFFFVTPSSREFRVLNMAVQHACCRSPLRLNIRFFFKGVLCPKQCNDHNGEIGFSVVSVEQDDFVASRGTIFFLNPSVCRPCRAEKKPSFFFLKSVQVWWAHVVNPRSVDLHGTPTDGADLSMLQAIWWDFLKRFLEKKRGNLKEEAVWVGMVCTCCFRGSCDFYFFCSVQMAEGSLLRVSHWWWTYEISLCRSN